MNSSLNFKNMHTIIGINGVIGEGLARLLLQKKLPVRGVGRSVFTGPWEFMQADALQAGPLSDAVKGSDVVYLCAGLPYNLKIWQKDWPVLMQNVIDSCLQHGGKLVFLDSVYTYGKVDGPMTEETPDRPVSKKGVVRTEIANLMTDAMKNKGLKGVVARAADFYGPGHNHSVLNDTVIGNLVKGKKANWLGKDDVPHSFTYTEDIIQSLAVLGTNHQADGQIWHLPTHKNPLTGKEYVELTAQILKVAPKYRKLNNFMVSLAGLFNPTIREVSEMMYQNNFPYIVDSSKFEKAFPAVQPTAYSKGIEKTVAAIQQKKA